MVDAVVTLGSQKNKCKGQIQKRVYTGFLTASIEEKDILEFWSEYEAAVNDVMLHEVDVLERGMAEYQFSISICGECFLGECADLQIYPSNGAISFLIPKNKVSLIKSPEFK